MGSFLVKRPDGVQEMMSYESERFTASMQEDGNVLSRSRVRSRAVTTAARSRRSSSYSLSNDAEDQPDRKRSVSCSVRSQSRERVATTAAFTWSPLPPRKGVDKLCVALFCDDTWANMEEFEALIDSLPGNEMPTPSHSNASSTLRRRANEEHLGNLVLDDDKEKSFFQLGGDLSSGEEPMKLEGLSHPPMRPFTNPKDTPTRHATFLQSPLRTTTAIGKEDLTLESLHDLEWLQRMEPIDQTILEAHIIWSILTLMVVLLACYSFQHHSL